MASRTPLAWLSVAGLARAPRHPRSTTISQIPPHLSNITAHRDRRKGAFFSIYSILSVIFHLIWPITIGQNYEMEGGTEIEAPTDMNLWDWDDDDAFDHDWTLNLTEEDFESDLDSEFTTITNLIKKDKIEALKQTEPPEIFDYDSTRNSPVELYKKDPQWIDCEQIKQWIQVCDDRHKHHCQCARAHTVTPYWLVDCRDACLVRADPNDQYVALSYVWGDSTNGQARTGNIELLQVKGALLEPSVPKTIRHVIQLLDLIDERYLWIDRLCILQDDDASKTKHINNMASIYSNAHMALVAAVGQGADDGLRGIQGITEPCEDKKFDTKPTAHQLTRLSEITATKWYARGWTFQEVVFSRRILYLTDHGASWECHCESWTENTNPRQLRFCRPCNKVLADIFRDSYFPPWPNLHMYLQLVAAYNTRQLSFDEDILAAFAGITTSLSTAFVGGFLHGLPELFLDVALLWQPVGYCSRRKPLQEATNPSSQTSAFPSWSWVGWRAEIDPLSWKCGYDYITSTARIISWPGSRYNTILKAGTSWTLEPTIQWHVADGKDCPTRSVIANYRTYQQHEMLPAGWSRYSLPFENPDEAVFVHSSDTRTRFRFPIPIPSPSDEVSLTGEDGPYLYFRTTSATFFIPKPSRDCFTTSVFDGSGNWAGIVRFNLEKPGFPESNEHDKPISSSTPNGLKVQWERELIAISEGSARNDKQEAGLLEEWDFPDRPRDEPLYEFVNVMCVTRENGICYREGIGRILKRAWHQKGPKPVDITLG